MLKIGVTGGIGSGKSTICKVFAAFGVPVYSADSRAREITEENKKLREQIIKLLGEEAYSGDSYNRKYVGSIVFSDREKLKQLNALIHPMVAADFQQWAENADGPGYVVEEAAILFESGGYRHMDLTLYISAPEDIRISRVVKRDKISPKEVQERINNQWPADKIKPLADRVIENDEKSLVLPQILELHNQLISQTLADV